MTRKILPILSLVATLFLVGSCDPTKNNPEQKDTLTVSPESLAFEAEDTSTKLLNVSTNGDWTASPSADWIVMQRTSGTGKASVSVQVTANPGEDRSGSISFSGAEKATVSVTQKGRNIVTVVANPDAFDGNKRSSTTYQLLIYSFADSNGDGVGDFKGIQNKLDYLDGLGVTALWLSPAHPSDSYHAYDVTDYYAVNPLYGTEQDFKNLIDAAHAKGIKIYMDYVLNHSGKGNAWFKEALANPSSKYRDYYFITPNPQADYSKFPMLKGTTYQSGEWKQAASGSPRITISKTDEAETFGSSDWNLYTWQDGGATRELRFKDRGDGTLYLVLEVNGTRGMLIRKWMNWNNGSKFGTSGNGTLAEGTPMDLVGDGGDISFTGNGRYKVELTNVSMETLYYMGCFSDWMPDLNYGDPAQAETNACFLDLAGSADKWINLGVDGLRMDAVKHICGGINSYNNTANQTLLKKWYDHCNATYKAAGHTDDIFIVAEAWDGHNYEKNYYKGINSCFEFDYGYLLRDCLKSGNASTFAGTVMNYVTDHTAVRPDAITSFFLSNHDQNRFATEIGKSVPKEKQAAAMLLSGPGKPFVYQGEELGYWGSKDSGDEYVRTPMMWDKAGRECAKNGVNGKVDNTMLKSEISVEAQSADANSILNVYKTWSRLRNTYPALADGTMSKASLSGASIAAWYMTAGGQKLLVIHNLATTEKSVTVSDDMSRTVALLGTATIDHDVLTLGPNSSVVFKL